MAEHARDIKPAQIRGDLYVHPNCAFPFADIYGNGVIEGEVHEYDMLVIKEVIDYIENGYQRLQTTTLDGEEVYVYHFWHTSAGMNKIESGKWEV